MSSAPSGPVQPEKSLKPTTYDNVASMIVALLVFVGASVIVLATLWLTLNAIHVPKLVPVEVADIKDVGEEGGGPETPVPTPELLEITEPITDASQIVPDTIALKAATILTLDEPGGGGTGTGRGRGNGAGPATEKPAKWEIRFSAANLDAYAKQLDHFGFELAAVGGDPQIDYVSQVSQAPGRTRRGPPSTETRPYFSWKRGSGLLENDKKLLAKAGIKTEGRLVLQYYPEAVYVKLATLEKQEAKGRKADKTIFGVKEGNGGYDFFVQQQTFLP